MAFSTCSAGLLALTRMPVCLCFNILKLTFFFCLCGGVQVNTSLLPSQGSQSFSEKSGCCKKHQFIVHLHSAVPVCGNEFFNMFLFFFFLSSAAASLIHIGVRPLYNMLLALFCTFR